jgi:apolipoprotein N-acyltransferase
MPLQLLAGLLYSLSFKPVGLWFLAPIAIAIQFHALQRFRRPELQSFIFAFLSSLIILSWSKTFVGTLPWISLALLQGILAIPVGIVARFTSKVPYLILITLLIEEVRARFPFGGFSWTKIAFSQVDSPFSHLVYFFGPIGLSLITLIVALYILQPRVIVFVVIAVIALGSLAWSLPIESGGTIRVRAIQGGVPERGLEFNARAQAVLDNHIDVTLKELDGSEDLIVWPENSIDIDPIRNKSVSVKLENLARQIKKPLIAGAILDGEKLLNSSIYFDSHSKVKSIYVKRYLTPFGEYIPFRSIASFFSPYVEQVTDFSPGKQFVVHETSKADVASIICYELLNDGIVRQSSSGTDFLLVQTNSATFSGSSEGEQQLAITRLRALESGKSIVSISTTGPSAVINARGEVLMKLEDGEVGSLVSNISLNRSESFYHSLGGLGAPLVLLLTLIWSVISKDRYKRGLRV